MFLDVLQLSPLVRQRGLKDATDLGGSLLLWYVILFKANDGNSAQVQPTNGRLSAQWPPLLHRSQQSTRITHTHLLPLKLKTQSISLPNPSSFPTRWSNPMRFQQRPSPDLNIPLGLVATTYIMYCWAVPHKILINYREWMKWIFIHSWHLFHSESLWIIFSFSLANASFFVSFLSLAT